MRSVLVLASLLSSISAAGCASRADYPERPRRPVGVAPAGADADSVAAEIVGKPVLIGELDGEIADQLAAARSTYEMAVYEARRAALDARIERELLDAEAKQRGVSRDALMAAEIGAKAGVPSDAEVRDFYDENQGQMDGASFEQIGERIRGYLVQRRTEERQHAFLGELRKAHGVKVLLDPPRVEVEAKGPMRGEEGAKVTIVIFSDFECPFCARAEPALAQIRETYPKDVKFVFRHYPLPFHDSARPAAVAASCAAEQGRFWELHDHLFSRRELGMDAIRAFLGGQPGFDLAKYDDCLSSGRGSAVVEADMAAAGRIQVDSTPHFFINGVRVSGAQPFEAFQSIIESELSR